jgi:hypothetical protein
MATDHSLLPPGPVKEVIFEELRVEASPGGQVDDVLEYSRRDYDDGGRVVHEFSGARGPGAETTYTYDGAHLVSMESASPASKNQKPGSWSHWKYDDHGKLVDYRRGNGDMIQNHETNFTRDEQGRLTGFEYHQGAEDKLASRKEFHYSPDGRTVETIDYNSSGEVTGSMTRTFDAAGRVVRAVIQERDWRTKKPKPPLGVRFAYDASGRLVEQNTDLHEFEASGSEHEIPPGKIIITYDDVAHTKKTTYSDEEASITSILTVDAAGNTIGVSLQTLGESFEARLNCTNDTRGNWTSCELAATKEGLTKVTKRWRRAITYR